MKMPSLESCPRRQLDYQTYCTTFDLTFDAEYSSWLASEQKFSSLS